MEATLEDGTGRPLGEKTIFFLLIGKRESLSITEITYMSGRAYLVNILLSPGLFDMNVQYNGNV